MTLCLKSCIQQKQNSPVEIWISETKNAIDNLGTLSYGGRPRRGEGGVASRKTPHQLYCTVSVHCCNIAVLLLCHWPWLLVLPLPPFHHQKLPRILKPAFRNLAQTPHVASPNLTKPSAPRENNTYDNGQVKLPIFLWLNLSLMK